MHGGRVWVVSALGKDSNFRMENTHERRRYVSTDQLFAREGFSAASCESPWVRFVGPPQRRDVNGMNLSFGPTVSVPIITYTAEDLQKADRIAAAPQTSGECQEATCR